MSRDDQQESRTPSPSTGEGRGEGGGWGEGDERARKASLDPLRSFIVQAPAGSGKTELLVQRYLKLLETVDKPEEIVAITFTIKAAAEMRERVLKKLPNAAEIAHRLRIQTFDALCAALTRQMPVLSRFGAQPQVVEDAREHYREAASRTLQELSPAVEGVLAHLDNNVDIAAALIASMLAKRDQWLRKTGAAPTRSELETSLRSERSRLLARACALHPPACVEFAETMLTKSDHAWRKKIPEAMALSGNEPLRQALSALLRMPPERYSDAQWQVLQSLIELLPLAAAQLRVVFAERGEADFTEIAQGAVRALGTAEAPTDLLLSMDARVRHLLVDEFRTPLSRSGSCWSSSPRAGSRTTAAPCSSSVTRCSRSIASATRRWRCFSRRRAKASAACSSSR